MDDDILLFEDNVISLRTVMVRDDGNLVYFSMLPAWLESSIPENLPRTPTEIQEFASSDSTYLYRHMRSVSGEEDLICGFFPVERGVKPMAFEKPPKLKLRWTDSGNSVALYLNGEPWAFIYEKTHQGYSKGVLDSEIKNLWNQELFEKIFNVSCE